MDDPRRRVLMTPEGLALPFTLASRGGRAMALLIDLACMGVVMLLVALALAETAGGLGRMGRHLNGDSTGDHALQALFVVWIIVAFLIRNAWFMAFELGPRGATPGKRIMGLRIAARDGARLTPERVIARNLLRDIELFLPLTMVAGAGFGDGGGGGWLAAGWFLIFALLPLFNRDRLRAGDLIAGTWVVERPRRKLGRAMTAGASQDYRFREADLAVYGEYELQRLEEVLRLRRPEQMMLVAETISGKIGWTMPGAAEVGPFLDAYYAQLRARLEGGMRMGRRKADKHA